MKDYQKRCGDYLAMVSILIQTALADLIADGSYKRHLDRLRIAFSTKHEAFVKSLDQVFGDRIDIIDRQAGSHLLISVRNDMSAQELTEAALEMGIKVYPVSEYYLNRKHKADSRLILGFGRRRFFGRRRRGRRRGRLVDRQTQPGKLASNSVKRGWPRTLSRSESCTSHSRFRLPTVLPGS